LMPLTTHAGVQGKSIGLGDAFQSGIRPVEWAEPLNVSKVAGSKCRANYVRLRLAHAQRSSIRFNTFERIALTRT
jgi:hypothetical protein